MVVSMHSPFLLAESSPLPLESEKLNLLPSNSNSASMQFYGCTTAPLRPTRKRSVRFDTHQTSVKHVASSRDWTSLEKEELWIPKRQLQQALQRVRTAFMNQEQQQQTVHPIYTEALAATYLACSAPTCDETTTTTPQHHHQVNLLAMMSDEQRGLENCVLPAMASERCRKRRQAVLRVVQLHKELKHAPDCDDLVAWVAQQWSASSRQFAQVLACADSLAALASYAQTTAEEPPTTTASTTTAQPATCNVPRGTKKRFYNTPTETQPRRVRGRIA